MCHILCRTIFWFKKSLSLIKSYLNICFVPFFHVPQNVPQTYIIVDWYSNKGIFVFRYMFLCSDEILNSLRVLFRVFFGYIFCKSVSLIAYCKSLLISELRRFPILKKNEKKERIVFFISPWILIRAQFFRRPLALLKRLSVEVD